MLKSQVRFPRAVIFANGVRIAWCEWQVNKNSHYQADTFRVLIPVKDQPPEVTRSWWAQQNPIVIEIYAGFPADPFNYTKDDPGMKRIIMGEADQFPHKLVANTIELHGRDYTSLMIDTKIIVQDKLNNVASDVALRLAEKYGFNTQYIQKTKSLIGTLYQISHTKMHRSISEWDFLTFLADSEGYEVYMDGLDLHFEPKSDTPNIITVEWKDEDENGSKRFDGSELTFVRNLTLAKDIVVYYRYFDIKAAKFETVKVEATHNRDKILNKGKRYTNVTQKVYQLTHAHMDLAKAKSNAYAILKNISAHQVKIYIDQMPANMDMDTQCVINVVGTTDYDQTYYPDSIVHSFTLGSEGGYKMDVSAKNHDVETQVPVYS